MIDRRVCLISLNLAGGGAQRALLNQAEMFSKGGYEVDILIMKNKVEYDYENSHFNVHFLANTRYISSNKLLNFLHFYKRMLNVINNLEKKNGPFKIFFSHSYDSDQLIKFLYKGNKFSVIHGTMSRYIKNWSFFKKQIFKFTYKNAKICAVSHGVKDDLLNKVCIKPKLLKVIFNSFNIEKIRSQSNHFLNFDNDYIIFVGSISKIKRLDVLLKAYKKAKIDSKLLILGGDGGLSEYSHMIKNLTKQLDLTKKVVFVNFVKNPYPYIKNAKLLVLSSDHEGLPTVLIEALILHTMVVSTNCESGPSEILIGDLGRYLSRVGDYKSLANKIELAIDNPIEISEKFYKMYDQRVVLKDYENLMRHI